MSDNLTGANEDALTIRGSIPRVRQILNGLGTDDVERVEVTLHFAQGNATDVTTGENGIDDTDDDGDGEGSGGLIADTLPHLALYELDGYMDSNNLTGATTKMLYEDYPTHFNNMPNLSTALSTLNSYGLVKNVDVGSKQYTWTITQSGYAELDRLGDPDVNAIAKKSRYVTVSEGDQETE